MSTNLAIIFEVRGDEFRAKFWGERGTGRQNTNSNANS